MSDPTPPRYAQGSLSAVLPAAAARLGSGSFPDAPDGGDVDHAIVVLIDGLGAEQLGSRGGHAPFLRSMAASMRVLDAGFPSTTATSMGSFGTGLVPGEHGIVGYQILDPQRGVLVNQLSWEGGPDPHVWQPNPTVFERLALDDVAVSRIGPDYFDGSGLTEAALRGGRFIARASLAERVDAALAASTSSTRTLVYLYWGDLDKVGHVHGSASWQWGDELESVDRELGRLAEALPPRTTLHITADHGMVDIPSSGHLDLADEPILLDGVAHVGGEPRCVQLYCRPGAAQDVMAAWRERMGSHAWVRQRDDAVRDGWFGTTRPAVLPRIGDVLVAWRTPGITIDRRVTRPQVIALVGHHGSLTSAEMAIPWIVTDRP